MGYELLVTLEHTDKGVIATCEELSAVASGATEEEALENLMQAVEALIRLLRRFSLELRERGSILVGRNRFGEPFTVHQHPSEKCYPQKLAKILKHWHLKGRILGMVSS